MKSRFNLGQISPLISTALLLAIAMPIAGVKASQAAEVVPPRMLQSDYLIGPGDQLEVSVAGYQEFTGPRTVLPDGTISLPVVGAIMATERTPAQLAAELKSRLDPYLVDPVVTVGLATLRPVVVNIAGEVQRPGPIQLRSLTTTTYRSTGNTVTGGLEGVPTLSSALAEAGGVTPNADIRQVVLRRTLPGGKTTSTTVNLWDAIWSDRQPEDLVLRAGDAIFVPRLTSANAIDRRLVARSRLAPATVRVRVVGEVTRPGEVQISPDSTISSAIAIAGGYTKEARPGEVQLIRLNPSGKIDMQQMDLSKLNDELQVQEGDVIVIPEKRRSNFLRIVGQILTPFGGLLNILSTLKGF